MKIMSNKNDINLNFQLEESKREDLVSVLSEVLDEVLNQDEKWGEQNYPCLNNEVIEEAKRLSGYPPEDEEIKTSIMSVFYNLPSQKSAQAACEFYTNINHLTFAHIAVEEMAEVAEAWDEDERREELKQLAAVIIQWIAKIDRNKGNN